MAEFPYMQFYVNDWMSDPQLSMCSPATRGIWQDALCAMHISGRTGKLSGTTDQLARICRCLPTEILAALADLQATKAGDVTICNGIVTLICRRMKREHEKRKSCSERVKKHRNGGTPPENPPEIGACNSDATDTRALNSEVRGQKSEEIPLTPIGPPDSPPQAAEGGEDETQNAEAATAAKASEDVSTEAAEEKRQRQVALKALSSRVGAIFHRKPSTEWSDKEKRALHKLFPLPEDELALIERYYGLHPSTFPVGRDGRPADIRRRDLVTLLNNWPGEVDRATGHFGANSPPRHRIPGQPDSTPLTVDAALWTAFVNSPDHTEFLWLADRSTPKTEAQIPVGAQPDWKNFKRLQLASSR